MTDKSLGHMAPCSITCTPEVTPAIIASDGAARTKRRQRSDGLKQIMVANTEQEKPSADGAADRRKNTLDFVLGRRGQELAEAEW